MASYKTLSGYLIAICGNSKLFFEEIRTGAEAVVPGIVSPAFRNGLVDTKLSGLRKRFFEKPLISTDS